MLCKTLAYGFRNVSSAQNDLQNTGPEFHSSNKIYFICKCKLFKTLAQDSIFLIRYTLFVNVS